MDVPEAVFILGGHSADTSSDTWDLNFQMLGFVDDFFLIRKHSITAKRASNLYQRAPRSDAGDEDELLVFIVLHLNNVLSPEFINEGLFFCKSIIR